MKQTITIEVEATPEETAQLKSRFDSILSEELRKIRREFRVGDRVLDIYGEFLRVVGIHEPFEGPTEYELWNDDGYRVWKAAKNKDIKEIL